MTKNAFGYPGSKNPKLVNKTILLWFGQYEGESVQEVMQKDASYLIWAIEQKIIDVEPWLYDEISELKDEQTPYWENAGPDCGDGWSWYESSDDPGSPRY
jgi:hypothetical protein